MSKPHVTVIMNTLGATPHLIEEAVQSFLDQTYENCQLKIYCSHGDGLYLDRDYPNIKVKNIVAPDIFWKQIYRAIKNVETDYWCVLDSDDYILPNHIEQMVNLLDYVPRKSKPIRVKGRALLYYREGEVTKYCEGGGWTKNLFQRLDEEQLRDLHTKLYRHIRTPWGTDSKIIRSGIWDIWANDSLMPTYLYRYHVSFHVSNQSKGAQRICTVDTPLPVITPQYHSDLKAACDEFNAKRWRANRLDYSNLRKAKL